MRGSLSDMSIASVRGDAPVSGEDRAPTFKGAIGRQAVRVCNGGRRLFSAAGIGTPRGMPRGGPQSPGFASRSKIAAARRPPLRSGRCAALGGAGPDRLPSGDRREGRDGRGRSDKGDTTMATDRDDSDFEPAHTLSSTDHLLTELQLYGHRPFQDKLDPRPLPEANAIGGAVADIFDALIATLRDTRLEPDLEDLLWSTVNLFHRAGDRVQRELDDNEDAQKRSQKEQDGSEIAQSNWNGSWPKASRSSNAATASSSSATWLPTSSSATPAHPGGRARARWSTIAR
jgi:hypothetical protein